MFPEWCCSTPLWTDAGATEPGELGLSDALSAALAELSALFNRHMVLEAGQWRTPEIAERYRRLASEVMAQLRTERPDITWVDRTDVTSPHATALAEVTCRRRHAHAFEVTTPSGVTLAVGDGTGEITADELVLAAIAAQLGQGIEEATTRRVDAEMLEVTAMAHAPAAEGESPITVEVRLTFPDTAEGQRAMASSAEAIRNVELNLADEGAPLRIVPPPRVVVSDEDGAG